MAKDEIKIYESPMLRFHETAVRALICISGNEGMYEYDYGDGGFEED